MILLYCYCYITMFIYLTHYITYLGNLSELNSDWFWVLKLSCQWECPKFTHVLSPRGQTWRYHFLKYSRIFSVLGFTWHCFILFYLIIITITTICYCMSCLFSLLDPCHMKGSIILVLSVSSFSICLSISSACFSELGH